MFISGVILVRMLFRFLLVIVLKMVWVCGKKFIWLRFCVRVVMVCGLWVMFSIIVGWLVSIWKCFGSLIRVRFVCMVWVLMGRWLVRVLKVVSMLEVFSNWLMLCSVG